MRPFSVLLFLLAFALITSCDSAGDITDDMVEITVLVAYTSQVAAEVDDIEAFMDRAFDETNLVYSNSGIDTRLVPAHLVEVEYEVEDLLESLGHLLGTDNGVLDELHPLRDQYEADVVILVSSTPGATINASVMAIPSNAFLILEYRVIGAPAYAFAHEMGHLHGARHFSEDDPLMEPFPYAHAFRNDSMHTVLTWGTPNKVPYFSGPGSVHNGVVLGDSTLHDNARAIRETSVYISNFRGPQTPTSFVSPGTWPVLE